MSSYQVDQIDHVELFVPNRRIAAEWYEQVLGLQVAKAFASWADDQDGPLMIATRSGGTKLALFEGEPRGERLTTGFHRVAFRVDRASFEAFCRHVQSNPVCDELGEELRELTVVDHGLAISVYFCDPYGHRLEVTTYEVGT